MKSQTVENGLSIAYEEIGDVTSSSLVIFVPGIMGNHKNLLSFATRLCQVCPATSALVVDVRNHGQSSKHWAPFTVEAAAGDIQRLVEQLSLAPKAVIGHSFGGKVALLAAQKIPSINQLWMLDCPIGPVHKKNSLTDRESMTAIDILDVLSTVSWPIATRKEVVEILVGHGISNSIALWMTTNLTAHPQGGLGLVFTPKEIKAMLEDFLSLDCWPYVGELSQRVFMHVLAAEHGGRLTQEDQETLLTHAHPGRAYFHMLNNSGHFVHSDNLAGLIAIMAPFFITV